MATETAGVGGLNIAETFPAGRGSPQGCGLRAVFLHYRAFCSPGKRRAAGERRGNYAKMALQMASLTCCVDALPFISGVFGPLAITCSIAARMPLCAA